MGWYNKVTENKSNGEEAIGCSNPTTTQKIYAHMIENSDENANDKISDVFYDEVDKVEVKGYVVKKLTKLR